MIEEFNFSISAGSGAFTTAYVRDSSGHFVSADCVTTTSQRKQTRTPIEAAKASGAGEIRPKMWDSEVWFPLFSDVVWPLLRLAGIAAIMGALLWYIDLPD